MGSFKCFTNAYKVDPHGAKFPASLHFVKRFKVPWILKWQYAKEGNVLIHCWYVKWWDKFPHSHDIINSVTQEFSFPTIPHIDKAHSPKETPAKANAPTTSSIKKAKSLAKSKKKISPLDDIRKGADALYALLKLKWKEEEAADIHDSEDEQSSKASIAHNPFYPYNQELFEHDEEETLDLGEN